MDCHGGHPVKERAKGIVWAAATLPNEGSSRHFLMMVNLSFGNYIYIKKRVSILFYLELINLKKTQFT